MRCVMGPYCQCQDYFSLVSGGLFKLAAHRSTVLLMCFSLPLLCLCPFSELANYKWNLGVLTEHTCYNTLMADGDMMLARKGLWL